jgi:hypothetical protein
LGAADYIALSKTFPVLFLADVPAMTLNDANTLRRFITLVDCLYEARTQVVMLAEVPVKELFDVAANKDSAQDEVFAFDRTVSRLMEMQGADYRQHHHQEASLPSRDGAALVEKALAGEVPWDGEEVFSFYDIDGKGSWDMAKLKAFLEDVAEVRFQRRDLVSEELVKKLATSTSIMASARGLEAFMSEGQGLTVLEEMMKKEDKKRRAG